MPTPTQMNADLDHSRMRETEERLAEAQATCNYARQAHFVMAERYADRAWGLVEMLYELEGPSSSGISEVIRLTHPEM
jgi:hypothetical protein